MTSIGSGSFFKTSSENWRKSWKSRNFRFRFSITAAGLLMAAYILGAFLDYIETRSGAVIKDPLLGIFQPVDLTWLTFLIIYLSVIVALISLAREPERLMLAMQAYILLASLRMLSMYLLPLDPPPLLIPLTDPFVESLSSGTLTRDLFFSGHTSTLFLLFLTASGRNLRRFFLLCTIMVAICVLIQHVHYTIDVVAAPFYSYTSYRIVAILAGSSSGN